jgi:hypothetical protein
MSSLIVEVCEVKDVRKHPNADRLEICIVKGWNVVIQKGQFVAGDKCVYIPYDAVLPPELANGPTDVPPGRLNVVKYCAPLAKLENGVRPPGCRVRAARLRGERSFGIMMKIDPAWGDDPNWSVGTDVAAHFGITKWSPPENCEDGDADTPHPRFHEHTQIQKIQEFPTVFKDGEEVVFTEKIHGKNNRLGLILDRDDSGNAMWSWTAGSHEIRRKEHAPIMARFDAAKLAEDGLLANTSVQVDQQFKDRGGRFWKVTELRPTEDERVLFKATRIHEDGTPCFKRSEFWTFMTDAVRALMLHLRDKYDWPEPKNDIVVFGELFGYGVQTMEYGRKALDYRVFDIAINGKYLDFDTKVRLLDQFGVQMVPVLYRGPFSMTEVNKYTDGPTTMCAPEEAGSFKGREGIVITPAKERWSEELNGRVILKSVSVDYLGSDQSDNR